MDQTSFHKNLVILAFIGAELAGRGEQILPPPSMARNSGPQSRARVNSMTFPACHSRSNAFLSLTFGTIETRQWVWFKSSSFAETHRLLCGMTYGGHQVNSSDVDLMSCFDIIFFVPTCIYFNTALQQEHDGVRIFSLAFLVRKLLTKDVCQKRLI